MEELVSIIMPNYNCEKYISMTIDSVIEQKYTNWELLIVDDCSTDGSLSIIKDYVKRDSRIKMFVNEKNSGAAFSRNVALENAKGKYIAFLDSDDLWCSDKLSKQISFMEDNDYHFTYTDYDQIDAESKPLNKMIIGPNKVTKYKMFRYDYIGCLTVVYDSTHIPLISINQDLKSRNDYAMWLKISKFYTCYRLPESLAMYRVRRGTLSHNGLKKSIKNQYKMFRISEKMNPFNAFFHTLRNLFWGFLKKKMYTKKK